MAGGHELTAAERRCAIESGGDSRSRRSRRLNDGARSVSGICCSTARPTQEGGAHTGRVRAEVPGRLRAGQSPEAERDCRQGDDPERVHLIPLLGSKKLDAITNEDVQRLKHGFKKAPKTVNNVLTVLERHAEEGGGVGCHRSDAVHDPLAADARSRHASVPRLRRRTSGWSAAARPRPARRPHRAARWGSGAAVRRDDGARMERCRSCKRQLCVQRSDWKGHVTTTKGGRLRYVPLTDRLAAALRRASASARRSACCIKTTGRCRSRRRSCRTGCDGQPDARTCDRRRAHPAAHVLFASGDAGRARAGDSGTRRASGPGHDAALHAPESGGDRERDSAAGSAGGRRRVVADMVETGSIENTKSFR